MVEVVTITNGRKESRFFFSEIAAREEYIDIICSYVDSETEEEYFEDAELGIIECCRIRDKFSVTKVMILTV
jgi:hypothetical protein